MHINHSSLNVSQWDENALDMIPEIAEIRNHRVKNGLDEHPNLVPAAPEDDFAVNECRSRDHHLERSWDHVLP